MRFTSTVLRGVLTSIFFPWLFLTRAMDFTEKQGLLIVQSDMLDVLKTGMFQLLVAAISYAMLQNVLNIIEYG